MLILELYLKTISMNNKNKLHFNYALIMICIIFFGRFDLNLHFRSYLPIQALELYNLSFIKVATFIPITSLKKNQQLL